MIDLVFWSFAVALMPVALALGGSLIAAVAGPLSPPAAYPLLWHGETRHAPHRMPGRVGRMGDPDHGL